MVVLLVVCRLIGRLVDSCFCVMVVRVIDALVVWVIGELCCWLCVV